MKKILLKKILIIIFVLAILIGGFFAYKAYDINKKTQSFTQNLSKINNQLNTLQISDDKESTYKDLIKESQNAISTKSVNSYDVILAKLEQLNSIVVKENENSFNDIKDKVSKLVKNNSNYSKSYSSLIDQVNSLIKNNNYKDALEQLNNFYNETSKKIKETEKTNLEEKKKLDDKKKLENTQLNSNNYALNAQEQLNTFFKGDKSKIDKQISITKKLAALNNISVDQVGAKHFLDAQMKYFIDVMEFVDWSYKNKYPTFFVGNTPIYKFNGWSNTLFIRYTDKNGTLYYVSKLNEEFEKGNLYEFIDGKKVKPEYKPQWSIDAAW